MPTSLRRRRCCTGRSPTRPGSTACSTGSSRSDSSSSRCAACRRTILRRPGAGGRLGCAPPAPAGVGACPTHWPAPLPGRSRSGGLKLVSSALAVRSCVPPLPAATVERPRLRAALAAHPEAALTLVGAPPGWGKTVLLSGWAAEHGAAWLTLGPRHADARRLWLDVCDALTRADVSLDGVELPLEDAPLQLADAP